MSELTQTEKLSIETIRTLSIDAIEKANSGHPGMPMGQLLWLTHYGQNL